jgi:hypothetical protein
MPLPCLAGLLDEGLRIVMWSRPRQTAEMKNLSIEANLSDFPLLHLFEIAQTFFEVLALECRLGSPQLQP